MFFGTLLAAGTLAQGADVIWLPVRMVDGNLNERAHLQAMHSEMRRECGAAPGSPRCRRLQREFQQEARNYQKRHRK
jgi:hypothetical protein